MRYKDCEIGKSGERRERGKSEYVHRRAVILPLIVPSNGKKVVYLYVRVYRRCVCLYLNLFAAWRYRENFKCNRQTTTQATNRRFVSHKSTFSLCFRFSFFSASRKYFPINQNLLCCESSFLSSLVRNQLFDRCNFSPCRSSHTNTQTHMWQRIGVEGKSKQPTERKKSSDSFFLRAYHQLAH